MDLIGTLRDTMARLLTRNLGTAPRGEERRIRRVGVGLQARLRLDQSAVRNCTIADATTEGIRLTLDRRVAPGTIAVIDIPFNGRRLHTGVEIRWTQDTDGAVEAGAAFLKGADHGVLHNFNLYLRWREVYQQAA